MSECRILITLKLPEETLRFYDGSGGVFVDDDGNQYRASEITESALSDLQSAINGEASNIGLSLISIPTSRADAIWEYDETISIVGSEVIVSIQELDDYSQASGAADIVFTGQIENLDVDDHISDNSKDEEGISQINIQISNKFTLRKMTSGSVLSDVDQRARSQLLNPTAYPNNSDEFCVRVPGLRNKTVSWPNFPN